MRQLGAILRHFLVEFTHFAVPFLKKDLVISDIHFSFPKMIGICYNHCAIYLMKYKTEMLLSVSPLYTSLFETDNHTSVALTKG